MVSIDDFYEIRECDYNNEHYSVRDNGAVYRHARVGKRVRKFDNMWTFGKPNYETGYLMLSSERVHRIVAYAFHGEPPTIQHVVDHIDTNRQNNRPENLRWVTKLENVLNNPITRARIEMVCGSIDAFLNNPSLLQGHENVDRNFGWMKTVSSEEAKASYTNLLNWAKNKPKPQGGKMGDWIFQEKKNYSSTPYSLMASKDSEITDSIVTEEYFKTKSLTTNAIQIE